MPPPGEHICCCYCCRLPLVFFPFWIWLSLWSHWFHNYRLFSSWVFFCCSWFILIFSLVSPFPPILPSSPHPRMLPENDFDWKHVFPLSKEILKSLYIFLILGSPTFDQILRVTLFVAIVKIQGNYWSWVRVRVSRSHFQMHFGTKKPKPSHYAELSHNPNAPNVP